MTHIIWRKHPYQPELNGTKEHVSRSVAENAVQFKQAELIPPAPRGTNEYLAERAALSAAANTSAPPTVSWGVHRGRDTERPAIVGKCSSAVCGTVRFDGKPEDAHIAVFTHSCSATPPEKAPAEVLNAYCAAVKQNQGTMPQDEANMHLFASSKGDSGKRAPLFNGYGLDGKPKYTDPWW